MILKIVKEPYPFNKSLKKEILSAVVFGLFVFLFLQIFQPFGLSNYRSESKTFELAGYGLVTFTVLLANNLLFSLLFPQWYSRATWTVGKNILYTTYMFFCIGLGNLFYSVWRGYLNLDLDGFLFYQGMTLLVGLFPVTLSTFVVYSNRLKKAINEANGLNSVLGKQEEIDHSAMQIPSFNKSEKISLKVDQLFCIKSTENYVELYFSEKNQIKKEVIRNTLKNLESIFEAFPNIQKCHRSYLVNLDKVQHFSGNAQGLALTFKEELNLTIPVSRTFVKTIKGQLSKNPK